MLIILLIIGIEFAKMSVDNVLSVVGGDCVPWNSKYSLYENMTFRISVLFKFDDQISFSWTYFMGSWNLRNMHYKARPLKSTS